MARGEEMNFFEAIFSFVFGDGDPNEDYEEKRWKLVSSTCWLLMYSILQHTGCLRYCFEVVVQVVVEFFSFVSCGESLAWGRSG
jgi:hypothetical protein